MNTYVILLRGINVGGKNIVPMAGLKTCLEELGFANVSTYIASGNVILESDKPAAEIEAQIEAALTKGFKLDSELIKVLVLSRRQLQAVIDNKPEGFGEQPEKYYSDAIFLMGVDAAQAMPVFNPREGVDKVWPGEGVIYSQRLSAERTKSRLSKIMASPLYKSMTIRSWNTTIKLLDILRGNMSYQVTMTDVEARPTAVVPATTTWQEFPTLWRELSNEVWACLHAGGITRGCRNIMLYWDDVPHVEVGVELLVPCPLTGRVRASALPAGQAAMTVHWGPYTRLGEAHQAVIDWCAAQGKRKTGTRWEVYGPHNDDPAQVWTEVYWLLA